MTRAQEKEAKDRYNFLIKTATYEEFSRICKEEGLVRGKQVELLMQEFIRRRKDG